LKHGAFSQSKKYNKNKGAYAATWSPTFCESFHDSFVRNTQSVIWSVTGEKN